MRPCVGVPDVCPALCTWAELSNGALSLADVERFNQSIVELVDAYNEAHRKP